MKFLNLSPSRACGHNPHEVAVVVFKTSTGNVLPLVKCESKVLKPAK